jgi:hypothetical protein
MDALDVVLKAAAVILTALSPILLLSVRRNLANLDRDITDIKTDLRKIAGDVGDHGRALAGGVVKFTTIETRLNQIEEWQREVLKSGVLKDV